jgi:hypothetical protein
MPEPRTLDQFALGLVEHLVRTHLEPKFRGLPLWDNGLGALAGGVVRANVPQFSGDQVAANLLQAMGLKQARRPSSRVRAGQASGRVIDVAGGPLR